MGKLINTFLEEETLMLRSKDEGDSGEPQQIAPNPALCLKTSKDMTLMFTTGAQQDTLV